jgi:hypothetical protein
MLCALFGIWCPQVDAFYYPNRANLSEHVEFLDVGSVDQCRKIVFMAAAENEDPQMRLGDYECGVGPMGHSGVYRETVK